MALMVDAANESKQPTRSVLHNPILLNGNDQGGLGRRQDTTPARLALLPAIWTGTVAEPNILPGVEKFG